MRDHDPIEIDDQQERRGRRNFYLLAAVILTALLFIGIRLMAG